MLGLALGGQDEGIHGVTHMRTASLGLPALINSASASSNLPYRERTTAIQDEEIGITSSYETGGVNAWRQCDGKEGAMARIKATAKNHIHTSSSRYIAYLR